jgi:hypothetical protein
MAAQRRALLVFGDAFVLVAAVRSGGWELAQDGDLYTLPLDTDEVRIATVRP